MSDAPENGTEDEETYRFTFDPDEDPSLAATAAVAEVVGCDQNELPPLYDAIDGDRLDAAVRSVDPLPAGKPVRVSFRYAGCDVTVTSHGSITVSVIDADAEDNVS